MASQPTLLKKHWFPLKTIGFPQKGRLLTQVRSAGVGWLGMIVMVKNYPLTILGYFPPTVNNGIFKPYQPVSRISSYEHFAVANDMFFLLFQVDPTLQVGYNNSKQMMEG